MSPRATPTSFHGRPGPLTAGKGWQQEGLNWDVQDGWRKTFSAGAEGSLQGSSNQGRATRELGCDEIAFLEIPARMREEMQSHPPWHDRSPGWTLFPERALGASKDGRILAPAGETGAGRHGSRQRAGENKSILQP